MYVKLKDVYIEHVFVTLCKPSSIEVRITLIAASGYP